MCVQINMWDIGAILADIPSDVFTHIHSHTTSPSTNSNATTNTTPPHNNNTSAAAASTTTTITHTHSVPTASATVNLNYNIGLDTGVAAVDQVDTTLLEKRYTPHTDSTLDSDFEWRSTFIPDCRV